MKNIKIKDAFITGLNGTILVEIAGIIYPAPFSFSLNKKFPEINCHTYRWRHKNSLRR